MTAASCPLHPTCGQQPTETPGLGAGRQSSEIASGLASVPLGRKLGFSNHGLIDTWGQELLCYGGCLRIASSIPGLYPLKPVTPLPNL